MLLRNISSPALSIYIIIYHLLLDDINEFDYSIDEFCEITGRGRSTIRKGLDDLVSYGVLKEIKRPGHTTLYKIIGEVDVMTPEEWEECNKEQRLHNPDYLSFDEATKEARKKTISRSLD
jgi:DNA-binding GntR family transcriptional regulator